MWDRRAPSSLTVLSREAVVFPARYPPGVVFAGALLHVGASLSLVGGQRATSAAELTEGAHLSANVYTITPPLCPPTGPGPVGSACLPCSPGFLRVGEACQPCAAGTFSTFTPTVDADDPLQRTFLLATCPTADDVAAARSRRVPAQRASGMCPAGYFGMIAAGSSPGFCAPCPAGTFQPSVGAATCVMCSASSYCPLGSVSERSAADAARLKSATFFVPQELADNDVVARAQPATRLAYYVVIGTFAALYIFLSPFPRARWWLARADLWGREEGQSLLGGFFTVALVVLFVPLIVLQSLPTLDGALKTQNSIGPYASLGDTQPAADARLEVVFRDHSEPSSCSISCGAAAADPTRCTAAGAGIEVCHQGVQYANLTCAASYSGNDCTMLLTYSAWRLVPNATQALTRYATTVTFRGLLTSASSIEVELATASGWPQQESGFRTVFVPERSNIAFRGLGLQTTLDVAAQGTTYKTLTSNQSSSDATGYYIRLVNQAGGETRSQSDFFAANSVTVALTYTLDDVVYRIVVRNVLDLGLAVLLGIALFQVLFDIHFWVLTGFETVVLASIVAWHARRNSFSGTLPQPVREGRGKSVGGSTGGGHDPWGMFESGGVPLGPISDGGGSTVVMFPDVAKPIVPDTLPSGARGGGDAAAAFARNASALISGADGGCGRRSRRGARQMGLRERAPYEDGMPEGNPKGTWLRDRFARLIDPEDVAFCRAAHFAQANLTDGRIFYFPDSGRYTVVAQVLFAAAGVVLIVLFIVFYFYGDPLSQVG